MIDCFSMILLDQSGELQVGEEMVFRHEKKAEIHPFLWNRRFEI
jgi:hypothetical protein